MDGEAEWVVCALQETSQSIQEQADLLVVRIRVEKKLVPRRFF